MADLTQKSEDFFEHMLLNDLSPPRTPAEAREVAEVLEAYLFVLLPVHSRGTQLLMFLNKTREIWGEQPLYRVLIALDDIIPEYAEEDPYIGFTIKMTQLHLPMSRRKEKEKYRICEETIAYGRKFIAQFEDSTEARESDMFLVKAGMSSCLANLSYRGCGCFIKEKKKLLSEALELHNSIKNSEWFRLSPSTDVICSYVLLYLTYEGDSPRLEKMLRKQVNEITDIWGETHRHTVAAKVEMARYYNMTYRFCKASDELRDLFSNSRPAIDVRWYHERINTLWGLRHWTNAEKECKLGIKIAKQQQDKFRAAELLKILKSLRKRKPYPQRRLGKAQEKIDNELYQAMKNFISDRACALCGKREGKLMQCAGCKSVWYCSREHQKKHWKKEHKKVCGTTICTCIEQKV